MTDMEPVSMLFLQALRASLEDRTVDWETDIERETWDALFAMAASHSVLPMIYAAVVRCPAARKAGNGLLRTVFPPGAAAGGALPLPERKAVSSARRVDKPHPEIREGDRRRFRRQQCRPVPKDRKRAGGAAEGIRDHRLRQGIK